MFININWNLHDNSKKLYLKELLIKREMICLSVCTKMAIFKWKLLKKVEGPQKIAFTGDNFFRIFNFKEPLSFKDA